MKSNQRNASLLMLGVLSVFVFIAPSVTTAFAWNACGLKLSPSVQTTTIPAGTTTTITFLLTYTDSSAYKTTFDLTASVTPGSPSGTWTIVSVTPPNPVPSVASDSISQIITVKVTAPATPGSSTTLTLKAVDNKDDSTGASCKASTTLTAGAFPPPPNGVPQFPFGIALLMALAIPALLVVKSKYSVVVKQ
jgi:hypothetical protein